MLALFLFTGVYFTVRLRFFQFLKFPHVLRRTLMSIFRDRSTLRAKDKGALSPFQAMSTALASTIGTGNIVGVATAICLGGPGAVFWMVLSAFFGMMTAFAENVLGVYYRYKNERGEWVGGPMVYLSRGLKCRPLAQIFSFFCVGASLGMGNMAQANSIAGSLHAAFSVPHVVTGSLLALIVGIVLLGDIKRIASVTEKLVPFMAIAYMAGAVYIIIVNIGSLPAVFGRIFESAFGLSAAGGGIVGSVIANAAKTGIRRGIFSNEAGLGSIAIVNAASDVKEPAVQGMWGIFEVFFDTVVVCTLTALVILSTGVVGKTDASGRLLEGAPLAVAAFSRGFGSYAGTFVAIAILLFAFSTLLGWCYNGQCACQFLFGRRSLAPFKVLYTSASFIGSVSSLSLVWAVSDTLNGLMALPNLIGVLLLSGTVLRIAGNYMQRTFGNPANLTGTKSTGLSSVPGAFRRRA